MNRLGRILYDWVIPIVLFIGIVVSVAFLSDVVVTVVAVLAVIFAGVSATVSRKSLQITRKTQRPFLNVSSCDPVWSNVRNGNSISLKYFVIHITNTGAFPADRVSIVFKVSKANNRSQAVLLKPKNPIASICFPNESLRNLIFEKADSNDVLARNGDELEVRIEVSYKNKLTNEQHKTIRNYIARNAPDEMRISPCTEEDYWE